MNKDEEADADDLATEVETDRTRQKTRRDLAKFRQQERVQMLQLSKKKKKIRTFASHFPSIFIVFDHEITDYVLGFFHQGKFAGSLLVKILLAYS